MISFATRIHSIAAVLLVAVTTTATAGAISGFGTTVLTPGSTGTLGPLGPPPAANNDDAGAANPNAIPYSVFFNALGSMDVEFIVANSGGTTEYRFPQNFLNNTGQTWTGFRFELGFGTGAAFVRSGASDALDFDAPNLTPAPTSTRFAAVDPSLDVFDWHGGTVTALQSVAFAFAIDVPDGLAAFNPAGLNRFTLRQTPSISTSAVPEPSTMLLLLAGAAALRTARRSASRE